MFTEITTIFDHGSQKACTLHHSGIGGMLVIKKVYSCTYLGRNTLSNWEPMHSALEVWLFLQEN